MKKIRIKNLIISNFKGIKYFNLEFTDDITSISGPNGSGKTSIFDAFTWLLFDKNSSNETKFDVKPLDENNKVIRVNTVVEAVIEIDGKTFNLKKTYYEKWVKRHGDTEKTFVSNETDYEMDHIPVKKSDYKKAIEENFTNEELFKLLTNPRYFSNKINWKERRELILKISGDVSDIAVINHLDELQPLTEYIEKGIDKTLAAAKATSKKLIENKKEIPNRIDELNNSLLEVDKKAIEDEIAEKEKELQFVEDRINGLSSNKEEINKIKLDISDYNICKTDVINKAKEVSSKEINKLQEEYIKKSKQLNEKRLHYSSLSSTIQTLDTEILKCNENLNSYRKEYVAKNNEQAVLDIENCCPTCKRAFDESYLENERSNILITFNQNKAKHLQKLKDKANSEKQLIEEKTLTVEVKKEESTKLFKEINLLHEETNKLNERIKELTTVDSYTDEDKEAIKHYDSLIAEANNRILKLQAEDNSVTEKSELEKQKNTLKVEISDLHKKLGFEEVNKNTLARIEELEVEEKQIAVKIADNEKLIMLCEKFITTKVELLESNINKCFKHVKFKLFEQQVNGGINETCEALIDGVPFSSANTASKLNAGLDIIKTISDYYQVKIPIFIDNRESIVEIDNIDSQIINLSVKDTDVLEIVGGQFNE